MPTTPRTLGAAVAGLLAAGLVAVPATAADPGSASAASSWLSAQAVDDAMPGFSPGYPDLGLTMDAIIEMTASGDTALAAPLVTKLDQGDTAGDYFTYRAYGDADDRVAGALAKTLVVAEVAGRDPRAFGGYDLVAELSGTVITAADTADGGRFPTRDGQEGRITDHGPTTTGNNANVFGQAMAVIGFAGVRDNRPAVIDQLVGQQCAAGWFRVFYATGDAPQTCDQGLGAGSSAPDRDATALSLSALLAARAAGATGLDDPIARAQAWLLTEQDAGGGWGGGVYTEAPNTNSTGLVVQALADAGVDADVLDRGAAYLRSAQVSSADAGTALEGETGAIAYDPAMHDAARADGIGYSDPWIRATAQAGLGLSQVSFRSMLGLVTTTPTPEPTPEPTPAPTPAPTTAPTAPPAPAALPAALLDVRRGDRPVLAGRSLPVTVAGLAPGEAFTVSLAGIAEVNGRASDGGPQTVTLAVPRGTRTGTRDLTVTGSTATRRGTADVQVVAASAVRARAPRTAARGDEVRLVVRALAPRERVVVRAGGTRLAARANARGVLRRKVRVTKAAGVMTIRVRGAYAVRTDTVRVRVTR